MAGEPGPAKQQPWARRAPSFSPGILLHLEQHLLLNWAFESSLETISGSGDAEPTLTVQCQWMLSPSRARAG